VKWRLLARTIATVHVAYVVFVVLGSLLVLVWPQLLWVHVAAVIWAGLTMFFDLGCPLSNWEKEYWNRGGVVPYEEGFLQHHVLRTRFDPAHSRRNHVVLGGIVVLLNLVVYILVVGRDTV
jgi:hypothetical protein